MTDGILQWEASVEFLKRKETRDLNFEESLVMADVGELNKARGGEESRR